MRIISQKTSNVLSSYGHERVINEKKPKMGQIKEKAKCKFLRPKGFEKSQIRGIWPQKSQSGNPGWDIFFLKWLQS